MGESTPAIASFQLLADHHRTQCPISIPAQGFSAVAVVQEFGRHSISHLVNVQVIPEGIFHP